MRQNIETIEMLEKAFIPENEANLRPNRTKVFDFENRKLSIGQWIDVKDTID